MASFRSAAIFCSLQGCPKAFMARTMVATRSDALEGLPHGGRDLGDEVRHVGGAGTGGDVALEGVGELVEGVAQETNVVADELDGGVDLMGDSRRQLAHRFELLGLTQLRLQPVTVAGVLDEAVVAEHPPSSRCQAVTSTGNWRPSLACARSSIRWASRPVFPRRRNRASPGVPAGSRCSGNIISVTCPPRASSRVRPKSNSACWFQSVTRPASSKRRRRRWPCR